MYIIIHFPSTRIRQMAKKRANLISYEVINKNVWFEEKSVTFFLWFLELLKLLLKY